MAFEGLAQKLQTIFAKLTGRGKLSESDIKLAMREVRLALLEADVNFLVVKKFVNGVSAKAVGREVMESLTPGQQVIKIVRDEMVSLLGGVRSDIRLASAPPTILLVAGLQGAGKTTLCGKLGLYFKKMGKSPMLVACDIYRPAAKEQLKVLGKAAGASVFSMDSSDPVAICREALKECKKWGNDIVIVDTAGRLHIDADMMEELKRLKKAIDPQEVLLVVDSMAGQDAVNAAKAFNEEVELSGIVLTKLDGDSRGGAALSVKDVTGKPIKFASTGETLADLEPFYPDRMASRILGMGDIMSLIEKAEKNFDEKQALEMQKKLRTQQFDLNDFLDQLQQIKKMGSMQDILAMVPGGAKLSGAEMDENQLKRTEAIIYSMTKKERADPSIMNGSRRKRIARGSGTSIQDVNRLLNQFEQMKKAIRMMSGKRGKWLGGRMGMPF